MTPEQADAFIRGNTRLGTAPLVPEIALYLASEITPIWQATEDWLQRRNIAPPFWAFAWPGSQALARFILDDASIVCGRRVLDFACGCGLAALAAVRAGAALVEAAEIDPLAIAALGLNARENGLDVRGLAEDVVGAAGRWDIVMCGDVCYEAPMARHILPWLALMAAEGAEVWMADPGRAYLPAVGLQEVARYRVPTSMELEDRTHRETVLFRFDAGLG